MASGKSRAVFEINHFIVWSFLSSPAFDGNPGASRKEARSVGLRSTVLVLVDVDCSGYHTFLLRHHTRGIYLY